MAEKKLSLKLLVDSNANKVLFAEVGKDFVDFLFHILSLPVGTVARLLNVNGMVGSIGSIYRSVESLNFDYFQANVNRDAVLKPKAAVNVPLLKLKGSYSYDPTKIYRCSYNNHCYASHDPDADCPSCGRNMNALLTYVSPLNGANIAVTSSSSSSGSEGYVKGVVTYMVMDNLEVKPMSTISSITLIKDVSAVVAKEVQVGFTEGLAMLKASFEVSDRVLTTVFLSVIKKAK